MLIIIKRPTSVKQRITQCSVTQWNYFARHAWADKPISNGGNSFSTFEQAKKKKWEHACCESEEVSSLTSGRDRDRTLKLMLLAIDAHGIDNAPHSLIDQQSSTFHTFFQKILRIFLESALSVYENVPYRIKICTSFCFPLFSTNWTLLIFAHQHMTYSQLQTTSPHQMRTIFYSLTNKYGMIKWEEKEIKPRKVVLYKCEVSENSWHTETCTKIQIHTRNKHIYTKKTYYRKNMYTRTKTRKRKLISFCNVVLIILFSVFFAEVLWW